MPRLLDLFCGVGGAAVGYARAGFDVVGVDLEPQPNYPFELIQADALSVELNGFDAIHASPPCQAYVNLSTHTDHPRLIEPVRERLRASGLPYVIENVVGSPLESPVRLCGSSFGLNVRRHRLFETSFPLLVPPCAHGGQREIRAYYGKRGWRVWTPAGPAVQRRGRRPLLRGSLKQAPADMGIEWAGSWDELREAIPPAFTELVGSQLLVHLGA